MLLVCGVDVWTESLELPKVLSLVHDRRTDMFHQCGSHILSHQTFVSVQCTMEVLRDTLSTSCEDLLVLVGLHHA